MVGTTKEEIKLSAIAHIGDKAVLENNKGNKTDSSQYLDAVYKFQLCDLLSECDWTFAKKKSGLTKSVDPGEFGFTYKYFIPTDCLKINMVFYLANNFISSSVNSENSYGKTISKDSYRVVGRFLHTDVETISEIEYIYLVPESDMSLLFANCFSLKLAMILAKRYKESLYSTIRQEYAVALRNAIAEDSKNYSGGAKYSVFDNDFKYRPY